MNTNARLPTFALDVSVTSVTPRVSGIQRLVRDLAEDLPPGCVLIRFDSKSQSFRIVRSVPRLVYRDSDGFAGALRRMLRLLAVAIYRKFSRLAPLRMPKKPSQLARRFYRRFLADSYLEDKGEWRGGEEWAPQPADNYFVIDIIQDDRHQRAVRGLRDLGVQLTFYVHDLIPLTHPNLFPRSSLNSIRADFLGYADLAMEADHLVVNSQETLRQFELLEALVTARSGQQKKVVYPTVKVPERYRDQSSFDTVESDNNPLGGIRLLGIGALSERKNFQVAIKCLLILLSMGKKASLTLVAGSSDDIDPQILSLLSHMTEPQKACLRLLGSLSDEQLQAEYETTHVVLVPSRAEGFGLPILEAIFRGKPVVANNLPVFREVGEGLPVFFARADDASEWSKKVLAATESSFPASGIPDALNRFPRTGSDFSFRVFSE